MVISKQNVSKVFGEKRIVRLDRRQRALLADLRKADREVARELAEMGA